MVEMLGNVFLPGDCLNALNQSERCGKTILGPGLKKEDEEIRVTKPGILRFKEPSVYWIDTHQKRYVPTRGEQVLGIIAAKGGDTFKVDIGSSEQASLSYLAFEGATKRNRPDVKVGDIVFGRLLVANRDMEPELVCIDSFGRSAGMGVIRDGGFLLTTSLSHVRKLLSPECNLLKVVGNALPYECSLGLNGRIWIKGRSVQETVAICNAISASEFMDNSQNKLMVRQMVDALAGF